MMTPPTRPSTDVLRVSVRRRRTILFQHIATFVILILLASVQFLVSTVEAFSFVRNTRTPQTRFGATTSNMGRRPIRATHTQPISRAAPEADPGDPSSSLCTGSAVSSKLSESSEVVEPSSGGDGDEKQHLSSHASTEDQPSTTALSIVTFIGSTTSLLVSFTFFAALALRRDAFMVAFFLGSISNGILSKVLKKVLNQERPEGGIVSEQPGDKGMPSSHGMSLGFIGVVTAMTLGHRYYFVALPIIALYVWISLQYRMQTQLHTKEQLLVGLSIGTLNGIVWKTFGEQSVMNLVSSTVLDTTGHLPLPLLAIPAGVGAIVVGSFERRIRKWIGTAKKEV